MTTRQSSPQYPSVDLEHAILRAKQVYAKESRHPASRKVLPSHWGYSPNSSGALRMMAALQAFNLLEKAGKGHLRLTRAALQIIHGEGAKSPAWRNAIRECALSPKLYAMLWEEYDGSLPSDATIAEKLGCDFNMAAKSIPSFLKSLKTTVEFAGLSNGDMVIDEDADESPADTAQDEQQQSSPRELQIGDYAQWRSEGVDQFPMPQRVRDIAEKDGERFVLFEGLSTGAPMTEVHPETPPESAPPSISAPSFQVAKPTADRLRFPLREGVAVDLTFWGPATQDDFATLIEILGIVQRGRPTGQGSSSA